MSMIVLLCSLLRRLKSLEATLKNRKFTLLAKLPDIESSLDALAFLEKKVFSFTFLLLLSFSPTLKKMFTLLLSFVRMFILKLLLKCLKRLSTFGLAYFAVSLLFFFRLMLCWNIPSMKQESYSKTT